MADLPDPAGHSFSRIGSSVKRSVIAAIGAAVLLPQPAAAQFFYQPPTLERGALTGTEPFVALPGATPLETEAALVWNLRAALNVAALQCDFAPTLLTTNNYNAMLRDHDVELKKSFDTLGKYFVRVNGKSKPKGQSALDRYGTRVYSGYSTVSGQYTFCMTANSVGRDAIFADRGGLAAVARARLRELRASLLPGGEQRFPGFVMRTWTMPHLPNPAGRCWKSNTYQTGKCGPAYPSPVYYASR